MFKLMGLKRKARDNVLKIESDKKWWRFSRKSKIKPIEDINVQHKVNFNRHSDEESEYYEKSNYSSLDNNHYR